MYSYYRKVIFVTKLSCFSATLFAKSKSLMLSHIFADVIEEEGGGKAGAKKKGGSMQTISATHRVSFESFFPIILKKIRFYV